MGPCAGQGRHDGPLCRPDLVSGGSRMRRFDHIKANWTVYQMMPSPTSGRLTEPQNLTVAWP
jgi:hypothetical protein